MKNWRQFLNSRNFQDVGVMVSSMMEKENGLSWQQFKDEKVN